MDFRIYAEEGGRWRCGGDALTIQLIRTNFVDECDPATDGSGAAAPGHES